MKKILLTPMIAVLLLSCTNDSYCDEELAKVEELRAKGWTNCNGGKACVAKIESAYQIKRQEILNNCN